MAIGVAIYVALVGVGVAPAWDFRETVIICVGGYLVIFFAALLLSLGEYLFTDRREQTWIPDERCLGITQCFAERLISRDFEGVLDLLCREYRARLTIDDLAAAFNDQCRRYGVPEAISAVRELRSEAPLVRASVCAVTRVATVSARDETHARDTSTLTLQLSLTSVGEQYQIVRLEYVPPCLASDCDDFDSAGFEYVPHAAVDFRSGNFVFCRNEVAITRRMIRDGLIRADEGRANQLDFFPAADADEIDVKDWDGLRIRRRWASDWVVIRHHRGTVVGALLARLAQDWAPDDLAMGRLREKHFDQAYEIWPPCSDHYCLADVVCQYLMDTCNGIGVFPIDDLVLEAGN
jgi:hypothetical protein